jgi:acyl carrier protein
LKQQFNRFKQHNQMALMPLEGDSGAVTLQAKAAFEDALTDGHKVTVAAPTFSTPEIVENPVRFAPVAMFDSAQSELPQSDTPQLEIAHLIQPLLTIVSEKTGYPAQMLNLRMDLEADLGIDSIKRVEILGAMQEKFAQLPPMKPEELAELRTLEQIVQYLGQQQGTAVPPATTRPRDRSRVARRFK